MRRRKARIDSALLPPLVAFGPAQDDAARLCSPLHPERFKVYRVVVREEFADQLWSALDAALPGGDREIIP
jgi:hypothetical protein